jgi:hypothetical protein
MSANNGKHLSAAEQIAALMRAAKGDVTHLCNNPADADGAGGNGGAVTQETQETQETQILNEIQEIQRNPSRPAFGGVSSTEEEGEKPKPEDPHRKLNRERLAWFAEFVKRPFGQFLAQAYEVDRKRWWDGITEEWQDRIFYFAWLVRGHPEMEKYLKRPKEAFRVVESSLRNWTLMRRREGKEPEFGYIKGKPWEEWFETPAVDARAAWVDCWERARFRPGEGPLQQAVKAARAMRLLLPPAIIEIRPTGEPRDEQDYEFFIGIAGHLQVVNGDQPIRLPCANIGEIMQVSKMTVSRYRKWGVEDKFLVVVREHEFRSRGGGSATEYRFNTDMYQALRDKTQQGTGASYHRLKL